uniref:folate gamma-glutamyl hydrolase n=1 Tax=viral metagenome TaxID=1070528 RepID=A0A6C0C3H0_9ZZZZ
MSYLKIYIQYIYMSKKTSNSKEINNQPVIGILTIPLSNWLGDNITLNSKKVKSYLPAAYVRWIENSGARVVPIQYTATAPIIKSYLSQINGLVICGNISPVNYATMDKNTEIEVEVLRWMKAEFTIFEWAKKQNNNGIYFPVMGVGMGYEELIFMNLMTKYYDGISDSKSAMDFDNSEIPSDEMVKASNSYSASPFILTDTPGIFAKELTKEEIQLFSSKNICYTTPGWAMNPKGEKIKKIKDFLDINSLGRNQKLKTEYINAYSFKDYPFYGVAFHPEAVIYSWVEEMIPQTDVGVIFSNKISEIFVNECRKNTTQLSSNDILIYNYTLFSPARVLKILYPQNWETVQLRKHFTNAYFFGVVTNVQKEKILSVRK